MRFPGGERARRTATTIGVTALLLATGAVALAASSAADEADENCSEVNIISARGTGEPSSGSLLLGPLERSIGSSIDQPSTITQLDYPASAAIFSSASTGVENLVELLNSAAAACPGQSNVVLGYSQGGGVVGDTLIDPGDRNFGSGAPALSPEAAASVAAVVLFGDMSFTAGEPFNRGTFDEGTSGVVPRAQGALAEFEDRTQSYCNARDFACQNGGSIISHISYLTDGSQDEATDFVAGQLASAEAGQASEPAPPADEPGAAEEEPVEEAAAEQAIDEEAIEAQIAEEEEARRQIVEEETADPSFWGSVRSFFSGLLS